MASDVESWLRGLTFGWGVSDAEAEQARTLCRDAYLAGVADARRQAVEERDKMRERHEWIVALSAGWDEDGSLGPRPPLSWESVGRMAMDYARDALLPAPAQEGQ